jgi:hypothetical protein
VDKQAPAGEGGAGQGGTFFAHVYTKLELPAAEIAVHLIATAMVLFSIAFIDLFIRLLGLGDTKMPWTNFKLSDAMLMLEVVAAIGIIGVGVLVAITILAVRGIKAIIKEWRAP